MFIYRFLLLTDILRVDIDARRALGSVIDVVRSDDLEGVVQY